MSLIPSLSSNASFSVQSPIGTLTYFPQLEMKKTTSLENILKKIVKNLAIIV